MLFLLWGGFSWLYCLLSKKTCLPLLFFCSHYPMIPHFFYNFADLKNNRRHNHYGWFFWNSL